jgi:hypothetical protein
MDKKKLIKIISLSPDSAEKLFGQTKSTQITGA